MSNKIYDMITAAKEGNPAAFDSAFKSEVATRVAEGINDRRAGIVSSMLGIEIKESEVEEAPAAEEAEVETE